jgi:hypothetical protein
MRIANWLMSSLLAANPVTLPVPAYAAFKPMTPGKDVLLLSQKTPQTPKPLVLECYQLLKPKVVKSCFIKAGPTVSRKTAGAICKQKFKGPFKEWVAPKAWWN